MKRSTGAEYYRNVSIARPLQTEFTNDLRYTETQTCRGRKREKERGVQTYKYTTWFEQCMR